MTQFAIYTYLFSPINEKCHQGELFPDGKKTSAEEAYQKRHELLGDYFENKESRFIIQLGEKMYGVMMLMNQDGMIVMKIANKKSATREFDFNVFYEPNEPSCFVIIDNRVEGIQSICIQPYRKAFTTTRQVAVILQTALNEHLRKHNIKLSINAKYSTSQFWQAVDKYPEGIKKVVFHFPYPNMPEISDRIRTFEEIALATNSEPSLVLVGQGGEPTELENGNPLLMNVIGASAASGKSIEMTPMGKKRRILIDNSQQVYEELPDRVMNGLLKKDDMNDLFNKIPELIMSFLKKIKLVYDA